MAEEYVEEESSSPLTRQIGPLQVWQWGLVVVGAYFLFRIIRGSGGSSSGSPVAVGTSAGATDEPFSGDAASLILSIQNDLANVTKLDALQDQIIASQNTTITNLNKLADLQNELNKALNTRISLQATIASLNTKINSLRDKRRGCTTASCRSTYDKQIADATSQLNAAKASLTSTNTLVGNLQTQINTLTSITVAPPNTTATNAGGTLTVEGTGSQSVPVIGDQNIGSTPITV